MMLVLQIIGYTLLVILSIIILILLTPFGVRLEGGRQTGLGWAAGYLGVPLRILGVAAVLQEQGSRYTIFLFGIPLWRRPVPFKKLFAKEDKSEQHAAKVKKEKQVSEKENKENDFSVFDFFYVLRTPNVRVIIGRLFRLFNPRGDITGTVGFDDPSDTGMLAAFLGFLKTVAPSVGHNINLNFNGPDLTGRFSLGFTIWIPQIIVGAVVIALSRDGRQLIAHLWGLRKRRPAKVA